MTTNDNTSDAFSEIIWPDKPALRNQENWAQAVKVVELLCGVCAVTRWLDGKEGDDYAHAHLPYHYELDGVEIEFLPHWGYYSVGGFHFYSLPTSADDVRAVVEAVQARVARLQTTERVVP